MSAEIRAWFEDYQHKLRSEERKEGRKEGERSLLLRQLRSRFGELLLGAGAASPRPLEKSPLDRDPRR